MEARITLAGQAIQQSESLNHHTPKVCRYHSSDLDTQAEAYVTPPPRSTSRTSSTREFAHNNCDSRWIDIHPRNRARYVAHRAHPHRRWYTVSFSAPLQINSCIVSRPSVSENECTYSQFEQCSPPIIQGWISQNDNVLLLSTLRISRPTTLLYQLDRSLPPGLLTCYAVNCLNHLAMQV